MQALCLDFCTPDCTLQSQKIFNMVLKEIHVDVPGRGRVDVAFYLHFDGHTTTVGELKIHTDYDSTLPHRAWLKQDDGEWKIFDEHPAMQNNEVKVTPEFLEDEVSREIVRKILAVKEAES